jgi:hypothetical protein
MRIDRVLRQGSVARIVGSGVAAAGLTFIGLGTAGVGTIIGGAAATNHCTAAAAIAKGIPSKVISNDQGTCDFAGNSTTMPALGYIAFNVSSGGTTTLEDILQSDGNDHDFYVGTYMLSFSNIVDHTNSANAVSTAAGTYTLAPGIDEGESGGLASSYPTEPAVTGALPTISGTAGDEVTAAYQVQFSTSMPQESFSSEKNDIFFNRGGTQESQAASASVLLLGIDSSTSSTTSSTASTTSSDTPSTSTTTSSTGSTTSTASTTSSDTPGTSTTTSSTGSTTSTASTTSSDQPGTSSTTTSGASTTGAVPALPF